MRCPAHSWSRPGGRLLRDSARCNGVVWMIRIILFRNDAWFARVRALDIWSLDSAQRHLVVTIGGVGYSWDLGLFLHAHVPALH